MTGVPPSGSGHSAEPEPCSTVSAVPASVPNARHEHTTKLLACIKELRGWVSGIPGGGCGAYPGHRGLSTILADALSAIDDELAAIDAAARDIVGDASPALSQACRMGGDAQPEPSS